MAAARRDDEIPLSQLTPEERCRLILFLYRIVFPEGSRPPDAPVEAYLQEMERVLTVAHLQGVDPPEGACRCSLELERWVRAAVEAEDERR
jgi:hypothetical protein